MKPWLAEKNASAIRQATVAALALLAVGCSRDHYELELRPRGDKLERQLTCWRTTDDSGQVHKISPNDLGRIDALYPRRLAPPEAARQVFEGEFSEKTPADIGGSGSYVRFVCPLGVSYVYAERFRGTDDIDSAIVARRLAADHITDLLLGWLEAELGAESGFDRLRTFVHEEFRKDLKNIGLHVWLSQVAANYQDETGPEFLARGAQLLLDRGYVRVADLPELTRAARQSDPARLGRFIARFLARKMGVDDKDPLPKTLDKLTDPLLAQESFERFLRTTEEFEQRQAAWEKNREKFPDVPPPQPLDVFTDTLKEGLVDLKLFSQPDALTVRLKCGVKPFQTNGSWDEEAGQIVWQGNADQSDPWTPFCLALWSEPDAALQQRLFGRVVLAGRPLAEYALWRAGLDDTERQEWDTFIGGLRPGADLEQRIQSFTFSSDAAGQPSLAETPRQLLLEGHKE